MKLANVLKNERTLVIKIGEENLNLSYYPSKVTPEAEDEFKSMLDNGRSGNALTSFLSSVIKSWDLVDEEGNNIDVTFDRMKKLPLDFIGECTSAIFEDLNQKKAK